MNNKFKLLLIAILVIITVISLLNHLAHQIKITAVFDDIELNTDHLPVFYKGFHIGNSIKIYLTDNSKTTSIDMTLNMKDLTLPDNISAKIKTRKKKEFIELEYPQNPSEFNLQNNDIILGHNCFDIGTYMDKQAESGGLDEIKTNLNNTVVSAGQTLNALTELFKTADEILQDMRPNLKESSSNLAKSSENIKKMTAKLNNSMDSPKIINSASNLEQATKNIEIATKNLDLTTDNLTSLTNQAKTQTMLMLDSTVGNVNKASANLNCAMEKLKCILNEVEHIVSGIKTKLSQNFSGIRVMFGKTVQ